MNRPSTKVIYRMMQRLQMSHHKAHDLELFRCFSHNLLNNNSMMMVQNVAVKDLQDDV
jgi:hypothetical protein